jgi:CTD nuclear envelope phosphatase 1
MQSCTQLPNGSYTKNLALVEQDLSRICLVDNSPICYSVNESAYSPLGLVCSPSETNVVSTVNGIPIEGWTHDPSDEALLDLLPVLDSLRFTSDVRRVLGIRGYS